MRIALGCDHRGFDCKKKLAPLLKAAGHEVIDMGIFENAPCDYPDIAIPVAQAVGNGELEAAILLDGDGIGMTIVANKVRGVRAALATDAITAARAREHNHCNVLCIGSALLSDASVKEIAMAFLKTEFGTGRHERRVEKITMLETLQSAVGS